MSVVLSIAVIVMVVAMVYIAVKVTFGGKEKE